MSEIVVTCRGRFPAGSGRHNAWARHCRRAARARQDRGLDRAAGPTRSMRLCRRCPPVSRAAAIATRACAAPIQCATWPTPRFIATVGLPDVVIANAGISVGGTDLRNPAT
ncbi:hypothetical protein ACU4HD_47580 [Cupriavidus basilensis]